MVEFSAEADAMVMYQGQYKDGQCVLIEKAFIPNNARLVIAVIDEIPVNKKSDRSQKQLEAFDKFLEAMEHIEDEPLSEEFFDSLANNRVNFLREVDL